MLSLEPPELCADDRLTIIEQDVYGYLLGSETTEKWDVILIDVDHAPRNRLDEASAPFYTDAGQQRVMRHLAPGGVLAVWSADRDELFAEVLDDVYAYSETEYVSWLSDDLGDMEDVLFLARRA